MYSGISGTGGAAAGDAAAVADYLFGRGSGRRWLLDLRSREVLGVLAISFVVEVSADGFPLVSEGVSTAMMFELAPKRW